MTKRITKPVVLKWKGTLSHNVLTATYISDDDQLLIAVVTLFDGLWFWKLFDFGLGIQLDHNEATTAHEAMVAATRAVEAQVL